VSGGRLRLGVPARLAVRGAAGHAALVAGGTAATGGGGPLVACVGDLMLDVRVRAPALVRGGDVPGSVTVTPGGAAGNVAVWVADAGVAARVVACLGDDHAGALLRGALGERGVELRPAGPVAGPSGATLVVWEAGERTFVADPGANLALRAARVRAGVDGAAAVYVSGYALTRPGPRRAALAAARRCGPDLPGVVDAASWPLLGGPVTGAVLAAAAAAGTLLANADEAAALTGATSDERAARLLAERVPVVVVKRGAAGALVAAGGRVVPLPAPPVEVVDTTGAGDAFAAGFLVARVRGAGPVDAARAGVAAAGRAVGVEGAWPPRRP
jgi:sugar/nucleoside kinase (ribokinase family)